MKLLIKWLVLIVGSVVVTSCSLPGGNIPADHFYRLPDPVPVAPAHSVDIKPVRAEGIYNERAMLYVEHAYPLEMHRYDYHFWVQTPAALVQNYLQGCLHDANTGKQPVKQMGVTIFAFERVVDNGKAQAVVKLRINNHDYEAAVPANTMDMHATVSAFGKTLQQICEAVARDLSS